MAGKKALKDRSPRQVQRGLYRKESNIGRTYYWLKRTYASPDVKAKWCHGHGVFSLPKYGLKCRELIEVNALDVTFALPLEYINGGTL